MSNKERLQANNTKLASLIQTLQGKAAGGGGGGGVRNIIEYFPEYEITIPANAIDNELPTRAAYICPWDEIDFDTVAPSNFVTCFYLTPEFIEMSYGAVVTFEYLIGAEYGRIAYTKYADGGCEFLLYTIDGQAVPFALLAKLNEDFLSTIGAEGEPGIYTLGLPTVGVDAPVTIMRFET